MSKLWSGRFEQGTAEELELFSESISFDKRLYLFDIKGSIAHADMLEAIGILDDEESELIKKGLYQIKDEIESNNFKFDIKNEDIHMSIESRLIEIIGDTGKKLHTARSRNDQVALDTRMFVAYEIEEVKKLIKNLLSAFISIAEKNVETIMPGYTHMQRAQVISLAHHMMAYYCMFIRDYSRLNDTKGRILNEMPLGSGALAGSTINIDRKLVASDLKFTDISKSSLDSVSDRDYIIEFNSNCAITMVHLSRLAEELILWSTQEFNFIKISDKYATGSSMMPQKKNPDIPELVRGKSARVIGNLMQILTLMKATPLAYNRDFQEDKESLFDTLDTTKSCISIITAFLKNISFNTDIMFSAAQKGYLNATEAMEYLIKRGIPNRDAHGIIGKAVNYCINNNKLLEDLTPEEWHKISDKLTNIIYADVSSNLTIENCLNFRNTSGGPSPDVMIGFINSAKQELQNIK